MYHSEAKFHSNFFLEITSGSMALFPLEPRQLWTWLAAWLASQLRGCSPSRGWRQLQLGSMRPLPPRPLPVLDVEQTPEGSGQGSGRCQRSGPGPPAAPGSESWLCGDPRSVPCYRFRKEANLHQADPGGWRG